MDLPGSLRELANDRNEFVSKLGTEALILKLLTLDIILDHSDLVEDQVSEANWNYFIKYASPCSKATNALATNKKSRWVTKR